MATTWNPSDKNAGVTLSNGNLSALGSGYNQNVRATTSKSSGKWYMEFNRGTAGNYSVMTLGLCTAADTLNGIFGSTTSWLTYSGYGGLGATVDRHSGTSVNYGQSADGDGLIYSMAFDLDNGKIWWAVNGVWRGGGDPAAGTSPSFTDVSGTLFPFIEKYGTGAGPGTANFGGSAFAHTPPSGFIGFDSPPIASCTSESYAAFVSGTQSRALCSSESFASFVNPARGVEAALVESGSDALTCVAVHNFQGTLAGVEGADTFTAAAAHTPHAYLAAVEGADTFYASAFKPHLASMAAVENTADTFSAEVFHTHFLTAPMVEAGSDTFRAYSIIGKSLSGVAINVQSTVVKRLRSGTATSVNINSAFAASKRVPGSEITSVQIHTSVLSLLNHGTTAQSNLVIHSTVGVRHCRLTPTLSRASMKEVGADTFTSH